MVFDQGPDRTVKPRRDTVQDRLERFVSGIMRKRINFKVLTYGELYGYMMQQIKEHEGCSGCVIHIEGERGRYNVTQALVDSEDNLLYTTTRECYGRKLTANALDAQVIQFMDGEHTAIMRP